MKYYLAYGSNLNVEKMKKRCPSAKIVGSTILGNYELVSWHYLNIIDKPGSQVYIGVWEFDETEEYLLDMYEAYPRLYRKEIIPFDLNGKKELGLIYFMNNKDETPPTEEYIKECLEGYDDFNFDKDILLKVFRKNS